MILVWSTLLSESSIHEVGTAQKTLQTKLIETSEFQTHRSSPLTTQLLHINTGAVNCSGLEILLVVSRLSSRPSEEAQASVDHRIPVVQGGGISSQGGRLF